ncbi:MAG: hypothetical protein Kow00109_26550 [Acidobacteriota bacterium]
MAHRPHRQAGPYKDGARPAQQVPDAAAAVRGTFRLSPRTRDKTGLPGPAPDAASTVNAPYQAQGIIEQVFRPGSMQANKDTRTGIAGTSWAAMVWVSFKAACDAEKQ